MEILGKAVKTGLWGVGWGVGGVGAYLCLMTSFVPLTKDDPVFKTKTWARYNPNETPALKDDIVKMLPLWRIRPELRDDEAALTLAFCRGVWSRWGFKAQSLYQARYDRPPGTEDNLWSTTDLAEARFEEGLRFSNHFEVVENNGTEIVVRCGASPLESGLRSSDGLIWLSARIDAEQQIAVFHFKSALFDSAAPRVEWGTRQHPVPAMTVFLHLIYVRMLTQSAMRNVKTYAL